MILLEYIINVFESFELKSTIDISKAQSTLNKGERFLKDFHGKLVNRKIEYKPPIFYIL